MKSNLSTPLMLISMFFGYSHAIAQEVPDFSGVWKAKHSDSVTLEITQDDSVIEVVRRNGVQEDRFRYGLDGSESRNVWFGAGNQRLTEVSRAEWLDGALVLNTSTIRDDGASNEVLRMYYLDLLGDLRVALLDNDIRSEIAMGITSETFERQQ